MPHLSLFQLRYMSVWDCKYSYVVLTALYACQEPSGFTHSPSEHAGLARMRPAVHRNGTQKSARICIRTVLCGPGGASAQRTLATCW